MISAVKTCDGLTTNYTYEYGEDGRLAAVKREGGRGTVSSTFEYNDEGLLTAERRSDGSIRYTWTKEERGGSNVTVGTSSPDYFDLSEDRTAAIRGHELSFCDPHYYEDRSVEPRYELVISAMDLEPVYIELETETLFEEKGILVELDPEQQKTAADNQAALAPYYPPLSGYTNDVDIPSASGGERLIRIVVEDRYQFHLNLVTEFGYNEDGSLASVSEYFDPLGTIHSFCYIKGVKYHTLDQFKTDKLGRITEFNPGYGGYYYSYRYGDDADSYTFIHTRTPGGQSYETTIKLEDQRLPAWIGQMTAADGGSGKLNMDSMEFDLAGYLTRFIAFIPPYGEKTVTYYYE